MIKERVTLVIVLTSVRTEAKAWSWASHLCCVSDQGPNYNSSSSQSRTLPQPLVRSSLFSMSKVNWQMVEFSQKQSFTKFSLHMPAQSRSFKGFCGRADGRAGRGKANLGNECSGFEVTLSLVQTGSWASDSATPASDLVSVWQRSLSLHQQSILECAPLWM